MKITAVKVQLLRQDRPRPVREMFVIPGQARVQFDRRARQGDQPAHLALIRVQTDAGIEGLCTAFYTWGPAEAFAETFLDAFRHELVGSDPLDREYLYQKLWFANRFNWLHPWMMSYVDVALWDIAGKAAGLPVCKLLGRFRDRIPTYVSSGNYPELERFVEFGLRVQAAGHKGYKLHSRLGPEMDIRVARAVREALGPDFTLMHDPVQTYTYPEAVRVGRALEELNYTWLEEPLQEYDLPAYKKLCDTLDIPIAAAEWVFGGAHAAATRLSMGTLDIVRGDTVVSGGITGLMKVAHVAEAFGANCEVHERGPLFCFVHAQALAAMSNCEYFELNGVDPDHPTESPLVKHAIVVEDGHMVVPSGPGFGVELDWDEVERRTVKGL
jgi:L-alanine-DL-glutamate epimerase-like enolase superfamily enzyme